VRAIWSSWTSSRVSIIVPQGDLVLMLCTGLKSILSGPAGGVVGYSLTSWDDKVRTPIIGFDMVRPIHSPPTNNIGLDSLTDAQMTGRNLDRRLALRRILRDGLREYDGWHLDPESSTRHQHGRCWRWVMPCVQEWSLPRWTGECRG
jgi:hypothetical protein